MVKSFLCTLSCFLVLTWCLDLNADVGVWVEPDNIDETQTLSFNIQSTDMNVDNFDESPLTDDFEIVSSRTNSQFRNINGQIQSWISWRFILRPLRTGTLTIPSLTIGSETTEAVSVKVRPLTADLKNQLDKTVQLESVLSATSVYVQAQLKLTRRLLYAPGFQQYGELPGPPELDNAVVVYLGQRTPANITRDNTTYQVYEQDYAIYPEKSGKLTIPRAAITGSVRLGSDRRRRGVRVQSESVSVNVLGIPDDYPAGVAWLPATKVTLNEQWQPVSNQWPAGNPITRSITAKAETSLGSNIPPFSIGEVTDNYKRYSEPVSIKDITTPPAHGMRQEAYSYVGVISGTIKLPAIILTWFDTNAQTVRYARLPEKRIEVAGGVAPEIGTTNPDPIAANQTISAKPLPGWNILWFIGLILFAGSGWLYALWYKNRKYSAQTLPTKAIQRPLANLKNKIAHSNPAMIRTALFVWLVDLWSCDEATAVERLKLDPDGNRVLNALNEYLYGQTDTPPPTKEELTDLINRIKGRSTSFTTNDLPELYNH